MLRALGSVSCDITGYREYDLLRALGSAFCDNTHETAGTICYGHWDLHLLIIHTSQGVRLVAGIGFCVLRYHTRDRGYELFRALGSVSCDFTHTRQGVRFVSGIGFCIS